MKSNNITYLPAIDHLRAFAAILIVLYHGLHVIASAILYGTMPQTQKWPHVHNPLTAFFIEGHTAVALFMVLSGFIFTYGCEGKSIEYSRFLVNRVIRIFPLFLFMLLFGISCYPSGYSLLGLAQALTLQANLPGSVNAGPFTTMFWTISVEFQFYLLFPFLIAFANRYGIKYLLGLMALFVGFRALTALDSSLAEHRWDYSYFTLVGRIDQFLFGMIAAKCVVRYPAARRLRSFLPLAMAAVIGMMYGFHILGYHVAKSQPRVLLVWTTVEGFVWSVFVVVYASFAPLIPQAVSRVLCYLGSISFSVYLVHMIVLQYAITSRLLIGGANHPMRCALLTTLALIPVIVLIASATYYLIERPFLDFRRRYLVEPGTSTTGSSQGGSQQRLIVAGPEHHSSAA
jgi:peptidoglycan/LPS O-acetylase OafA/YrhL